LAAVALAALAGLSACGSSEKTTTAVQPGPTIPAYGPSLNLQLPNSLTGGTAASPLGVQPMAGGGGEPCNFVGNGGEDPFINGYSMTRFLVGVTASWSCIADNVRLIVDILVFYGVLVPNGAPWQITDRDPDDPPYVSLTESGNDREVRLFWGPTTNPGDEGWYLAWNDSGGIVDGVLIIDVVNMGTTIDTAEDPEYLRMDFHYTDTEQTADAFLSFFLANLWADAFRIHVFKDKDLVNDQPKYTARGILALKAQFDPNWFTNTGDGSVPGLNMYTVADAAGNGAALALMSDIGLSLDLQQGDHLGHFLFGKNDRYFFSSGGAPEYVLKAVTPATYLNGKAIVNDGNFPNSEADVDAVLSLGGDYATCTGTEPNTNAVECENFLDALFGGGSWGVEANFGTDPGDWRSTNLATAEGAPLTYFLADPCPNNTGGCTWTSAPGGVFEMTYPPNP
jgi:hypothetical protein